MIIVLKPKATQKQINHIIDKVKKLGLKPMISKGVERTIIGVIGEEDIIRIQNFIRILEKNISYSQVYLMRVFRF